MAATAQAPAGKPRRRVKPLLFLFLFLLLVVGGFAAYVWSTLHISYSEGERAGYVQKFSRKGWVCKTWEGEMAMVTLPGTVAEKFLFTVREDDLAKQLSADIGKRVTLHYEQRKWIPTSCFGDTEYFVTSVQMTPPAQPLTQP